MQGDESRLQYGEDAEQTIEEKATQSLQYTLILTDPCIAAFTSLLRTFLTNNVDVNLSLTEVLTTLSRRPDLRLDGWLAMSPSRYKYDAQEGQSNGAEPFSSHVFSGDAEENAMLEALTSAKRPPLWLDEDEPLLFGSFRLLEQQVTALRQTHSTLDEMLGKRKIVMQATEPLDIETLVKPEIAPDDSLVKRASHSRTSSLASTRNSSPARPLPTRGRQPGVESAGQHSSPAQSGHRTVMSPQRLSMNVFRPPPPDSPISPRQDKSESRPLPAHRVNESTLLQQRLTFQSEAPFAILAKDPSVTDAEEDNNSATLSHVLTNIVILQNFVLELTVTMQLRAVLFQDVNFV